MSPGDDQDRCSHRRAQAVRACSSGVAGAQSLLLLDEGGVGRERLHGVAHQVRIAPDHDDHAGSERGHRRDGIVDERRPQS